jgi:hypothetical protein
LVCQETVQQEHLVLIYLFSIMSMYHIIINSVPCKQKHKKSDQWSHALRDDRKLSSCIFMSQLLWSMLQLLYLAGNTIMINRLKPKTLLFYSRAITQSKLIQPENLQVHSNWFIQMNDSFWNLNYHAHRNYRLHTKSSILSTQTYLHT